MLRQKNLFAIVQKSLFSLTLLCFSLLISLGNVPRFLETSLFSDHLLLTEIALYFFAFLSLPFLTLSKKSWLTLGALSFCTLISFFYGCLIHGADLHAALYVARLIAFYYTSAILAALSFQRYKTPIVFFRYLCKGYAVALILGFCFFLFFPASEVLWKVLSSQSILFHGDPHVWRFVSVYFDPNYYAAIAGIPCLLSLYLYQSTSKKRYALFSFLCALSALLTQSRSGLFTLFLLLLWLFFVSYKCFFSKRSLKVTLSLFLFFIVFSLCFFEEILAFAARVFSIKDDPSALYRFETFKWGVALFKERPLFGTGYNFLYSLIKQEIGLNSLDSSLLALLVQIGAIPFSLLLLFAIHQGCFLKKAVALWKRKELKGAYFLSSFICYGGLILGIASQFNQLLFYPFWALPFTVIALFLKSYLKSLVKTEKQQTG